MAKFINTRKAVSEIEDLIKNATEKLTLISPYLKLSKDFKELLTFRNNKDKITTIIFGKQELNPEEMKFHSILKSHFPMMPTNPGANLVMVTTLKNSAISLVNPPMEKPASTDPL